MMLYKSLKRNSILYISAVFSTPVINWYFHGIYFHFNTSNPNEIWDLSVVYLSPPNSWINFFFKKYHTTIQTEMRYLTIFGNICIVNKI